VADREGTAAQPLPCALGGHRLHLHSVNLRTYRASRTTRGVLAVRQYREVPILVDGRDPATMLAVNDPVFLMQGLRVTAHPDTFKALVTHENGRDVIAGVLEFPTGMPEGTMKIHACHFEPDADVPRGRLRLDPPKAAGAQTVERLAGPAAHGAQPWGCA
jgi:hypothetical protein